MEKIQTRITEGTYLLNNPAQPIRYGQIEIYNAPTKATRTSKSLEGILCKTVITGFCGSDYALMRMGKENNLSNKFPSNLDRLINGHEGIVYVPEKKKYAIVLIRGGPAKDPSRFTDDEDYFEYGCDRKDGLLSNNGIYASFTVGTKINFETLEFGFKNQLIYGAINFRRDHMEEALNKLPFLPFDEVVKIYDIEELKNDTVKFYEKVFKQEREIVKGAVLWNEDLIEE